MLFTGIARDCAACRVNSQLCRRYLSTGLLQALPEQEVAATDESGKQLIAQPSPTLLPVPAGQGQPAADGAGSAKHKINVPASLQLAPSLTLLLVPAGQGQREDHVGQERHAAVPAMLLR